MHQLLDDTLAGTVPYYRFNPLLPTKTALDETAPEKLRELQAIGREYMRREPAAAQLAELAELLKQFQD